MIHYLRVPVDEYGAVIIEIEPSGATSGFQELGIVSPNSPSIDGQELGAPVRKAIDASLVEATHAFDRMMQTIRTLACGFHKQLHETKFAARPTETSIEFGLTLKADAGVVVARAGVEPAFTVKLTWKTPSAKE